MRKPMIKRYLEDQARADLKEKMVFLGGPRQVGKTTLARTIITDEKSYLNWDAAEDRERILKRELPTTRAWIFDEIHKYRSWRNYLKGLYDKQHEDHHIIVTGSAKLDYYRFGGDSLQGRYHYLRLHPFCATELELKTQSDLLDLLKLGGFPEPFLGGSERKAKRWSREYRTRLIRDDLLSLEQVQDIGKLELLLIRLPELVGSPLSLNALREDLQVSHKTVDKWLLVLERLYSIFRLAPFGAARIRAVKKEQKHYHYDWSLVPDMAIRFENLVASCLLKWVHYQQDINGEDIELNYFRDIDGREVDFVVTQDRKPVRFIEAKWSDSDISRGMRYLKARFPKCEAWQISAIGKKDYLSPDGIQVCGALKFLNHCQFKPTHGKS